MIEELDKGLRHSFVQAGNEDIESIVGRCLSHEYSLYDLLKRPEVNIQALLSVMDHRSEDLEINEQVEIDCKYEGYIERQSLEIERLRAQQEAPLPMDFDYCEVPGLSSEVVQKLNDFKPATLGQASRISGVTPAAVSLLMIYIKKRGPSPNIKDGSASKSQRISA